MGLFQTKYCMICRWPLVTSKYHSTENNACCLQSSAEPHTSQHMQILLWCTLLTSLHMLLACWGESYGNWYTGRPHHMHKRSQMSNNGCHTSLGILAWITLRACVIHKTPLTHRADLSLVPRPSQLFNVSRRKAGSAWGWARHWKAGRDWGRG